MNVSWKANARDRDEVRVVPIGKSPVYSPFEDPSILQLHGYMGVPKPIITLTVLKSPWTCKNLVPASYKACAASPMKLMRINDLALKARI